MIELKSFPFDSIVDDREYPASIFRNYFYKFLTNGVYFGSYKNYGDYSMKVMPQSGLNITVKKGAGILRGLDFELEEDTTLAVRISLEQERKDMVVVRTDDTLDERRTTLYIKEGTDTDFPELERTTDVYEICLAKISVGDTVSTITIDDIEDTRRDSTLAGIVTSLIDIDIQDVLDDITTKKEIFFEELEITTRAQAEAFIDELEQYCDDKKDEADEFIDRLRAMLQELQHDMIPAELVTIDNPNYESNTLDDGLTEIANTINNINQDIDTLTTSVNSLNTNKADNKKIWTITLDTTWEETPVYTLTSDVSIDSEKTYYTRTGSGTSESPYVYTEVEQPDVADIATYYEVTSSEEPYTKTISLEGMLGTYVPMLDIIYSNDNDTAIQEASEYAKISKIESGNGTISLTCFEEKPSISLNVRVEVMF